MKQGQGLDFPPSRSNRPIPRIDIDAKGRPSRGRCISVEEAILNNTERAQFFLHKGE